MAEFDQLKADRRVAYNEAVRNDDKDALYTLLRDGTVEVNRYRNEIDEHFRPQYWSTYNATYLPTLLEYEQDDQKYFFNEYPMDGAILQLTNFGRMYILEGGLGRSREKISIGFDDEAYAWIMLQVKYQIGDRTENWLYLAYKTISINFGEADDITAFAGYNMMISGKDALGVDQVYARLELDFYNVYTPSRIRTDVFLPIRPALDSDAIEYGSTMVKEIRYPKLKVESLGYPSSGDFEDSKLLRMMTFIA